MHTLLEIPGTTLEHLSLKKTSLEICSLFTKKKKTLRKKVPEKRGRKKYLKSCIVRPTDLKLETNLVLSYKGRFYLLSFRKEL